MQSCILDLGTKWANGHFPAPASLPMGKEVPLPISQEIGLTPVEISVAAGYRTPAVQHASYSLC
jgi:hypothetical protein